MNAHLSFGYPLQETSHLSSDTFFDEAGISSPHRQSEPPYNAYTDLLFPEHFFWQYPELCHVYGPSSLNGVESLKQPL